MSNDTVSTPAIGVGWLDAHGEIEHTPRQVGQQRPRRGDRERELDLGSFVAKRPQHVGEVGDGSDVDHSEPDTTGRRGVESSCPVDEIGGCRHDLSGVVEHRRGRRPQHPAPPVRLEQSHADAPFQFGEALRQRGRAHADAVGSGPPGGGVGDRHEVLQLADRDVGERGDARWWHLLHISSDLLHNPTSA